MSSVPVTAPVPTTARRSASNAALYRWAIDYVTDVLRRLHCRVEESAAQGGLVLRVAPDGTMNAINVVVRISRRLPKVHRVTVGGHHYRYIIQAYHWNLHQHGIRLTQPDVWVLVPADDPDRSFVVPAREIRPDQKSVALIATERGHSRLRAHTARWETITGTARRAA